MKYDCDLIRDLLPLYADGVCSETSRAVVEEHLDECPDCRRMAAELGQTELEDALREEKESVIAYAVRRFRRRSAAVGSAVSGAVLFPILVFLVVGLIKGVSVSWVTVVAASLCVAASLIVVPIAVPRDKAFWMFWAFTASLVLLLGVVCLYTHGNWFRVAAGGSLFGLSAVFLPFVIRAEPMRRLIGDSSRALIVLGVDVMLFFNLLNAVATRGRFTLNNLLFTLGAIAGVVCVVYALLTARKPDDR